MDKSPPEEVARRVALGTFFGMFAFALLLCADRGPILAPFFPAGLLMGILTLVRHYNPAAKITGLSGGDINSMGYAVYVLMFVIFYNVRRWRYFWVACFILAGLLILNVSGCRAVGTPRIE
jgi:hypothetical protein